MWRPCLTLLVLSAACGRHHTLQDGTYAFSLKESLRDDCNFTGAPGVLSQGALKTTGHVVALDYGLFGIDLNGNYLADVERMTLDGSAANVNTQVNGGECLLDLVGLHLDGATTSSTSFEGIMAVRLDARRPDRCVCEVWFKYVANRQ
ncbi:MAG: hypothetical protein K1X89_28680 [Myxococcaceae bacterium]|nr:hypothetical protein [Myxococcaceae bacterium]